MPVIDYKQIVQVPNKYNLTPRSIKKLKISDWDRLKEKCWLNTAMKSKHNWYCHLEGSQSAGQSYDDEDEFWIGFQEDTNKINCHFSSFGGMCGYTFSKFYDPQHIHNQFDINVQVNALRWLNEMIDKKILSLE